MFIYKICKFDLLIINGDEVLFIVVIFCGIKVYEGKVLDNKCEVKMMDMELVDVILGEVFGDEKMLIFV